jgi:hypothetical protein
MRIPTVLDYLMKIHPNAVVIETHSDDPCSSDDVVEEQHEHHES